MLKRITSHSGLDLAILEGCIVLSMMSGQTKIVLSPWRCFAASLALFALVFAGTLASLAHSVAMAATSITMMTASTVGSFPQDHSGQAAGVGHDHKGAEPARINAGIAQEMSLPHDHNAVAKDGENTPGNCDQGCVLCKDCALCGLFAFGERPMAALIAYYVGYALPMTQSPAGLTPALPSEPPRV